MNKRPIRAFSSLFKIFQTFQPLVPSSGIGLSNKTGEKYVEALESAFYHAECYVVVGRRLLKTNGRYYASDPGMRDMALAGSGTPDVSRPIENAVYLELMRRGYTLDHANTVTMSGFYSYPKVRCEMLPDHSDYA